jgi:hypothetical protein
MIERRTRVQGNELTSDYVMSTWNPHAWYSSDRSVRVQ